MQNFYYSKEQFDTEITNTGSKLIEINNSKLNKKYMSALIETQHKQLKAILILI